MISSKKQHAVFGNGTVCVLLLFTISTFITPTLTQITNRYRLCVPDVLFTLCSQMVSDSANQGGRFDCVPGNDKIDCISRVTKGEADLVILEPEEIFVAHRFFHDAFFVASEIRTIPRQAGSFRYEPVAVVRNSAQINSLQDLRGKKSCHTAFGRTSGWEVPIARLMQKGVIIPYCPIEATTTEREIASVYNFFGSSCAPGEWAPDPKTDRELKQKYSQMCSLCRNPQACKDDDKYAGFRGSLRCLTENGGDVAWTRLETVYQFFSGQNANTNGPSNLQGANRQPLVQGRNGEVVENNLNNGPTLSVSEYSFLCPDGTSLPINTNNPCTWAGRPWKAFIASNRLSLPATVTDVQQQITLLRTIGSAILNNQQPQLPFSWLGDILEFSSGEIEFHVPSALAATVTPLIYLDRGNYTVTIEKPSCPNRRTIRLCVRNDAEKLKCLALRMAAMGRRILPYFECVLGEDRQDCMLKISSGIADVMSVDAREAFVGSRKYRLTPILSEAERFGDEDTDASRYAVAIVRADSGIQTIADLRGKRSCHGSVSSLTGWNIPLIVLRDSGLIYPIGCNFGRSLAGFFAGSCIPGAADPTLNLPDSLCSLCVGTNLDAPGIQNPDTCSNNELEGFYGDLGAFRCLPTLAADVAFTDHLTPLLNTDGLANATWAAGLQSTNFRLVCPYGPTRAITEFRQCHWGKIPEDKVITSEDKNFFEREDTRLTLLKASQTFHPEQTVLRLFGPFYGIPNLLFKDISTGLVPLTDDELDPSRKIDQYGRFVNSDKDVVYDQQYANRIIRDVDECSASSSMYTQIHLILASFLTCMFVWNI